MPLKRPDGRWIIIKINVINELPLFVSAGGSAPELMGMFSETTGHLLFYSTGCLINPNVPARMPAFLSASSAREMVALLAGMRARIFFWRAPAP